MNLPRAVTGGLILTYNCSLRCRHCLYASGPEWRDWASVEDIEKFASGLARACPGFAMHIAGGEPFGNVGLVLRAVEMAAAAGLRVEYVETNASWCTSVEKAKDAFAELKRAGLLAIFVSVSPFHAERMPLERTLNAIQASVEVFGPGRTIVWKPEFLKELGAFDTKRAVPFESYLDACGRERAAAVFSGYYEMIPSGRAPEGLREVYPARPAGDVASTSCTRMLSPYHIHVDLYGNYIGGLCAGLSLGDGRELLKLYDGLDIDALPLTSILVRHGTRGLLTFARERFDFQPDARDYIGECHLCTDVRRHIVERTDEFAELAPRFFYSNLGPR